MNQTKAWLVKNCPDFHFMPSLRYDRAFVEWKDDGRKMSPEYWQSVGFQPIALIECDEASATHWLIDGARVLFDDESADAVRARGCIVVPLRVAVTN